MPFEKLRKMKKLLQGQKNHARRLFDQASLDNTLLHQSQEPQFCTDEYWLVIERPEREEVPFDLEEFLWYQAKVDLSEEWGTLEYQ
ncbi:hypothetical protein SAMN04488542_13622 [Fontibacillus panacisegetis]|uniref:Uncharacterized protein n=1 Tax=Fontibacillus panacisegetis TaxID=670482 RepID=A0A1G7TCQ8_9BACL|nr:hypothetical protein [Fontibacillus panacisegetis]SDG33157.1 hypothetical protein SAMN04488542_13622 [Fontibacillus panacisegetis]